MHLVSETRLELNFKSKGKRLSFLANVICGVYYKNENQ